MPTFFYYPYTYIYEIYTLMHSSTVAWIWHFVSESELKHALNLIDFVIWCVPSEISVVIKALHVMFLCMIKQQTRLFLWPVWGTLPQLHTAMSLQIGKSRKKTKLAIFIRIDISTARYIANISLTLGLNTTLFVVSMFYRKFESYPFECWLYLITDSLSWSENVTSAR